MRRLLSRRPLALASMLGVSAAFQCALAQEAAGGADLDTEQGLLESEIQRLSQERRALEQKEQELQKAIREQTERLNEQRRAVENQSRQIEEQQRTFEDQRRRLDELKIRIEDLALPPVAPGKASPAPAQPVTPPSAPPQRPTPPTSPAPAPVTPPQPAPAPPAPSSPAPQPPASPPPAIPVGRAPEVDQTRPPIQVSDVLEQRGILTPRGTLTLEPGLQYVHSSVTRVALEGFTVIPSITIGAIDIRAVRRSTLTGVLGMRYGVTSRFQVEASMPFVSRADRTTTRPLAQQAEEDSIYTVEGSGLGDVEMAGHYQLNQAAGDWPYFVANLRIKSRTGKDPFEFPIDARTGLQTELPTGSGFWGVQPALTFTLPSDPAVFFGSISYSWNIKREVSAEVGEIDPGDALGLSLGMGLALNPRASMSLGYSHNSVAETRREGRTVKGSTRLQVGTVLLGMSHRLGRSSSFNFGLGVGVTEDAPDVQASIRLPTSFRPGRAR